jgi:hypothetical protein
MSSYARNCESNCIYAYAYIGAAVCLNVYGQSQNANGLSLPETVATATATGTLG